MYNHINNYYKYYNGVGHAGACQMACAACKSRAAHDSCLQPDLCLGQSLNCMHLCRSGELLTHAASFFHA